MTSKSLFFKLMKEDLKRKVWAVGLAFLSFFFVMPVAAAMRVSDILQMYERWIANGTIFTEGITAESRKAQMLLNVALETIGVESPLNVCVIVIASIVMALTGFMYLHSRKQMDFYHSIPVRREEIFAVKYLNGILIILSAYLINMIFAFVVLAVNGVGFSVTVPVGLTAFAIHAGGYVINYGLMTIAVMLTGNFFISILGGIVLFAYMPAAVSLVEGLMYLFLGTVNTRGLDVKKIIVNGSPLSYYIKTVAAGSEVEAEKYGTLLDSAGVCVVVGLVMAVIALLLYRKRPSESAGKSMAFRVTKTPIKIFIVVPVTIFTAVFFRNVYYSIPWSVFGFIAGLVVTHCIVEIIYHFEFRKLFSNLHHMGISAALALGIIAVFRFDLAGYDNYVPKESEFQSASVYVYALNDWTDYGLPYKYESGNDTRYNWRYMSGEDYAVSNMKVTDYGVISRLADAGRKEAGRTKKLRHSYIEDTRRNEGFWTMMEVGYQLKNGKTVYRNYTVDIAELRDVFDALYVSDGYKSGIYPVYSYTVDNITGIYEAKRSEIHKVDADRDMQEKILNAYREDLAALTLEERASETPVTSLRFLTVAEYEYLSYVSADRNANYTGDFRLEDMNFVNFFPVYPSFKKTLALLEETGIDDFGPVDVSEVERIEIYSDYYTDEKAYYDAPVSYYEELVLCGTSALTVSVQDGIRTITLQDDGTPEMGACMKEVLTAAVDNNLAQLNGLQGVEYGIIVRVYMKDVNEGRSIAEQEFVPYLFPADEIPDFVKETFKYDTFESKNVNFGLNIIKEK